MPYIDKSRRSKLIENVVALSREVRSPGELNFVISTLVWRLFNKDKRYQTANDILGALEGAKLEFYRIMVAPYEDIKIKENGDLEV